VNAGCHSHPVVHSVCQIFGAVLKSQVNMIARNGLFETNDHFILIIVVAERQKPIC